MAGTEVLSFPDQGPAGLDASRPASLAQGPDETRLRSRAPAWKRPDDPIVDTTCKRPECAVVELDHRSCGSIDVSLFWNRETDALFVQVVDWVGDEDFSLPVDRASAAQAFLHPFAYAPPPGVGGGAREDARMSLLRQRGGRS